MCALRGGTKGTAEPALLRMTWRETPRPAPWPATGRGRPPSRTACAALGAQAAADLIGAGPAGLAATQAFRSQLPQDAAESVRLNVLPRPDPAQPPQQIIGRLSDVERLLDEVGQRRRARLPLLPRAWAEPLGTAEAPPAAATFLQPRADLKAAPGKERKAERFPTARNSATNTSPSPPFPPRLQCCKRKPAQSFLGSGPFYQAPQVPEGSALGGNGNLTLLHSHGRRLLNGLRCATLHLLRALPCLTEPTFQQALRNA